MRLAPTKGHRSATIAGPRATHARRIGEALWKARWEAIYPRYPCNLVRMYLYLYAVKRESLDSYYDVRALEENRPRGIVDITIIDRR